MKSADRLYAAIDLKSFYASVECVERGLDPLDSNLVIADASRTNKTICLGHLKCMVFPGGLAQELAADPALADRLFDEHSPFLQTSGG